MTPIKIIKAGHDSKQAVTAGDRQQRDLWNDACSQRLRSLAMTPIPARSPPLWSDRPWSDIRSAAIRPIRPVRQPKSTRAEGRCYWSMSRIDVNRTSWVATANGSVGREARLRVPPREGPESAL